MSGPACALLPWFSGANTVTPVDGVGGFRTLVPIAEPASAGAPPTVPSLINGITVEFPGRAMADAAGYDVTAPLGPSLPRVTCRVSWTGLSKSERDALCEFLAGADDVGNGLRAFALEPDGPDTGSVAVRPTAPPRDEYVGRGVYRVWVDVEEGF
jgi:hypothetical protein